FRQFLVDPGGLARYAAAFLAQTNCNNGLGALVFTMLAAVVYVLTRLILQAAGARSPDLLPMAAPLALLFLRDRYDAHSFLLGVGLVSALAPAAALWLIPPN